MNESSRKFFSRYQISLLDNNKRHARPNYNFRAEFFLDPLDMARVNSSDSIQYYTEPLLTITIPESRLEDLISLEEKFFSHVAESGARTTFSIWLDHQNEERRLRGQYPAVQAAYEQYSTMLHLVKHSK